MELVTASQLAEKLQISKRTVYRLIRENKIPRKRLGGQWRFDIDNVIKSLSSNPTSRIPDSRIPNSSDGLASPSTTERAQ
jgi:excisionase family DNA binding protein